MNEWMLYGLVAAAVIAAFLALFGRRVPDAFSVDREVGFERLPNVFKLAWGVATACESSVGATLALVFPRGTGHLAETIPPAALPLTPARVYATSLFLGCALGFLALLAGSMAAVAIPEVTMAMVAAAAVCLFAVGWFWPSQNLKAYAERRQEELVRQLPFAIDLISSAMRSGLEFGAAVRYYTGIGLGGALPEELSRVLNDVSLGKSFAEALKDMDRRVKIDAFSSFVGAVSYGAEVGAPISETLKIHGAELRRARFAVAERKAARAPVVMILPLVLFIMPSVFIVVLTPMVMQLLNSR